MALVSQYDAAAPSFDRHRALPDDAVDAIRAGVLTSLASASPRLLDLGAGTGRIGRPFIAAGDDYVGVDLSFGMLREFAPRAGPNKGCTPRLVQADGERLPRLARRRERVPTEGDHGGRCIGRRRHRGSRGKLDRARW